MTRIALLAVLFWTLALPCRSRFGGAASEHLDWGRWSFDYEVKDSTGLALRHMSPMAVNRSWPKPACRSCA